MAVTAASVRPLEGAILRHYDAGGSINAGDAYYVAADDDVEATDANAAATSEGLGIIVAGSDAGETAFEAGDAVTGVVFGPVGGFSSLTPGAKQYISATTGAITESAPTGAGTWTKIIGYAESATILFVMPQAEDASSNS